MVGPTCGEARRFLQRVADSGPVTLQTDVALLLRGQGAITPDLLHPRLTEVGVRVLKELNDRADRVDELSLATVSQQIDRILRDFHEVAQRAEYFLADLGPLTPTEAVPLLRPVGISLANRRISAEDLAEKFRNLWGSVEVMGGSSSDRLLAACLLAVADAPLDRIYSPLNALDGAIQDLGGKDFPLSAAALLLLRPVASSEPLSDRWRDLRSQAGSDLEAALLGSIPGAPPELVTRRSTLVERLGRLGAQPEDARETATLLLAIGRADSVPDRDLATNAPQWGKLLSRPFLATAMLATAQSISMIELNNWLEKAITILRRRHLAPTEAELTTLGIALVEELPPEDLSFGERARWTISADLAQLTARTAARFAWLYLPLVAPSMQAPS